MTKEPKAAKKSAQQTEYEKERFRIIFEYSPIAIWEEDFSALGKLRAIIEREKVTNIRQYLHANPELVKEVFRSIRVVDVNQAALRLYGAKSKKELIANLGKTVHKDAFEVLVDEFASLLEGKGFYEAEFQSRTLTGKLYDVLLKVSVPEAYRSNFTRVIATLQDVSVQKGYERNLRRLARTDGLTGLLNHAAIRCRLEEEFVRAKRYHLQLACMMIDLDSFKLINDHHGHSSGDKVLKRAATLLRKNLREVDMVGRYGGDEFFVILPETPVVNAKIVARRLCDLFGSLAKKATRASLQTTVSIGVCGCPNDEVKSAKELIDMTDRAMYQVKRFGRNNICVCSLPDASDVHFP